MTDIFRAPSLGYVEEEVQRLEHKMQDIGSGGTAGVYDDDPRLNQTFVATTVDEIKNQLLAASQAGGGTVVIAGQTLGTKTYTVEDLYVPSNVRLVSRGGVLLQAPANSEKRMLSVALGDSHVIVEGLTFDHGPAYHGTVYYDDTTTPDYKGAAPVLSQGEWVFLRDCEVRDSALDAMRFGAGSQVCGAFYCRVYGSDRYGITGPGSEADPTRWFTVAHCDARNTYGSGVGANGALHYGRFLYNDIRDTGGAGDAVAAYSQHNIDLKIIGNLGVNTRNNGTHPGGKNVWVLDNSFYSPAEYGIYVQANDRSDETAVPVPMIGAVIDNNYVESAGLPRGRQGLYVGYYTDVEVGSGNRIVNSGSHGFRINTCDRISVGRMKIRGAAGCGILSVGTRQLTAIGTYIQGHTQDGVLMEAAPDGTRTPNLSKVAFADIRGGTYGVRATSGNKITAVYNDIYNNSQAKVLLNATNSIDSPNI